MTKKLCRKRLHQMTEENKTTSIAGLVTCRSCTKEMIERINDTIIEKAFADTDADALLIQTANEVYYVVDEGSITK